ncbi:hypothetical protein RAS12_30855 (plasmid) [Achromobacter seleniivolatilans]|uniref:Uncharacterized protein n=1 Tax=Achromobacter seleniivolatilans TaxID=3047478 RepID=A0ABY9MBR0_9BURK|nr:hypothetical protein [Achromobacter sp. R39]WMD24034.1 hypothetical protein RAS12_30855 [Achromobacter sp. R39]
MKLTHVLIIATPPMALMTVVATFAPESLTFPVMALIAIAGGTFGVRAKRVFR